MLNPSGASNIPSRGCACYGHEIHVDTKHEIGGYGSVAAVMDLYRNKMCKFSVFSYILFKSFISFPSFPKRNCTLNVHRTKV